MTNWKKDKIIEIYHVWEQGNVENKRIERTTVKNPSINKTWFYHIGKKNIDYLEQMINEKIVDINIREEFDGETILHRAIRKRSLKLIDFCIKHKADFHIISGDEETPLEETTHRYISLKVFKKIWLQVEPSKIAEYLTQESPRSITMIERLCTSDKNIPKLLWLEKTFPEQWQELKNDTKNWDNLIEIAKDREANDTFLFLKGLQKIKNDLKRELQNKIEKTKRLKI
jgi:hypothetical protein